MRVIVDAMGGDNAPLAIVQGALEAQKAHCVEIVLVGRAEEILKAAKSKSGKLPKPPQEILCDYVNTQMGLKGYCVKVLVDIN